MMIFSDWLEELDDLGCSEDPIDHGNWRTTVTELSHKFNLYDSVSGVKISYYDGFKKRWVKGTCLTMLRERRKKIPKKPLDCETVIAAAESALESDNRHYENITEIWGSLRRYIPSKNN
jgi:hypothetical protein